MALTFGCEARRALTMSSDPFCEAIINAVMPALERALTSAPSASSTAIAFFPPDLASRMSGKREESSAMVSNGIIGPAEPEPSSDHFTIVRHGALVGTPFDMAGL